MLNIYNYTPNELLGSLASFLLWQRWILFPTAEEVYKNTILKKSYKSRMQHLHKLLTVV